MRQRTAVLVVVFLSALVVTVPLVAAAGSVLAEVDDATSPAAAASADGNASQGVSPGQRLTGVVGAQRAEVEGEIETRSFGVRVTAASSSRAKAGVVAEQVNDLQARLTTLQNQKASLEQAHENGSLSEGQYRARVTPIVARIRATERLINATSDVASDLPDEDLESAGVRSAAIAQLRKRARNMSGPETAALARAIVGDDAGRGIGNPPAGTVSGLDNGAPANRGNATTGNGAGHGGQFGTGGNATAGGNVSADANGTHVDAGGDTDGNGVSVDADANTSTTAQSTAETTSETVTATAETRTETATATAETRTETATAETQTATETTSPVDGHSDAETGTTTTDTQTTDTQTTDTQTTQTETTT